MTTNKTPKTYSTRIVIYSDHSHYTVYGSDLDDTIGCCEFVAYPSTYEQMSYGIVRVELRYVDGINNDRKKAMIRYYVDTILYYSFLPCAVIEQGDDYVDIGFHSEDLLNGDHTLAVVTAIRYLYHPAYVGIIAHTMMHHARGEEAWQAFQMAHLARPDLYYPGNGLKSSYPWRLTNEDELIENAMFVAQNPRQIIHLASEGEIKPYTVQVHSGVTNMFSSVWSIEDYAYRKGYLTWSDSYDFRAMLGRKREERFKFWRLINKFYSEGMYNLTKNLMEVKKLPPLNRYSISKEFDIPLHLLQEFDTNENNKPSYVRRRR